MEKAHRASVPAAAMSSSKERRVVRFRRATVPVDYYRQRVCLARYIECELLESYTFIHNLVVLRRSQTRRQPSPWCYTVVGWSFDLLDLTG
jgi:hypothetical protein